VPAEVEPPELARLVAFAERSRTGDWSLRSALCRYAQPHPMRVSAVLDLVRRIELALHPHTARLDREGPELWAALQAGEPPSGAEDPLVGLLRAIVELDRLGDTVADWAVDRFAHHPEAAVDAMIADVAARLERLGVPEEERTRPPRQPRA
jgi:hypothetical protein